MGKQVIRTDVKQELLDSSGIDIVIVKDKIPTDIIDEIMSTGIAMTGAGNCGKTTFARVINRELTKLTKINVDGDLVPAVQIKIFDTALNWVKSFEPILYQTLNEKDIFNTEIYFDGGNIIFECSDFTDVKAIREVISAIVGIDYELQRQYKLGDLLDTHVVYTIEEAQNILSVIGKYDRWNTYISQGRNMNISFIFITRRMADISTKASENVVSYMWGRTTGYNDRRRIKNISNELLYKLVPTLDVGEFIYWNGSDARLLINKDVYETDSKPVLWE